MTKHIILGCLLAGAAIATAAAQMPKYGVTVTAEKDVDFATFRTYSWTSGLRSQSKVIDGQITAAVDYQLSMLGMTKTTPGPGDVLVTYSSLTRTDVDLNAKTDAQGRLPPYSVGTLVVVFLEPGSRRRLLRLRIDKPIETEPAMLEAAINSAVAEMFAKYPTRGKK
jgi:Domain of unknown function (DUF4136)